MVWDKRVWRCTAATAEQNLWATCTSSTRLLARQVLSCVPSCELACRLHSRLRDLRPVACQVVRFACTVAWCAGTCVLVARGLRDSLRTDFDRCEKGRGLDSYRLHQRVFAGLLETWKPGWGLVAEQLISNLLRWHWLCEVINMHTSVVLESALLTLAMA